MEYPRSSGVLMHPTSLPGPHGIGDLGGEAYRFANYLQASGQSIWQVLPLGPTGYADSPYQSFSAFAGNPLLLSLDRLVEQGLLTAEDISPTPGFPENEVDFGPVIAWKKPLIAKAARAFQAGAPEDERHAFDAFCGEHAAWLDDYALFMALKEAHELTVWNTWGKDIATRDPEALGRWQEDLSSEVFAHKHAQFEFFRQWRSLKGYCNERGIRLMGDIPIYVAHDSADVWAHPELYHLDESGAPTVVAGVPPDYFSATGQLWGNPIYRWDLMAERGYQWWLDRLRMMFSLVDIVRIDHFRGFAAYWEVPGDADTAINGQWVNGPGAALFNVVRDALGDPCIVAENLGLITDDVEELREQFGFPGMAVLHFAFGTDVWNSGLLPHIWTRNTVAYTGTHDNDTTIGWWHAKAKGAHTENRETVRKTRAYARQYLGTSGRDINRVCIQTLMASVADTVIFPLQDIFGLDTDARMNIPGTCGGKNWRWRFTPHMLSTDAGQRLRELTETYGRLP
jgi:4-alpha-glucanotransferase